MPASRRQAAPVRAFSQALAALGATDAAIEAIANSIERDHEDPTNALLALFDATGLSHQLDDEDIIVAP